MLWCSRLIWYAVAFALLYHLLDETKEKCYPEKVRVYIIGGIFCTVVVASLFNIPFIPVKIIIYILLCSGYSYMLYRYRGEKKIPYGLLFGMGTSYLLRFFRKIIQEQVLQEKYAKYNSAKLLPPIISTFLATAIILFYRVFMSVYGMARKKKITLLEVLSVLVITAYNICCLKVVWILYFYIGAYEKYEMEILCLLLGLAVINIYFLSYTSYLQHSNELRIRLERQEKEEQLTKNYYEHMELNYSECKRILHDVKNHMQVLEALYQTGAYEAASDYSNTMTAEIDRIYPKEYSSNKMLNVIMYDKLTEMEKYGIDAQLTIEDVTLEYIEFFDLAIILCNIFDNAITCLKKMHCESRRLVFKLCQVNGFDVIFMENPIGEEIRNSTEKKEFFRRVDAGTGLQNVCRVVKKYHGDISYNVVDEKFQVSIYFCR